MELDIKKRLYEMNDRLTNLLKIIFQWWNKVIAAFIWEQLVCDLFIF